MNTPMLKIVDTSSAHGERANALEQPTHTGAMACGKAILVGEHAVVYGARAVAIPLPNLHLSLQVSARAAGTSRPEVDMTLGGAAVPEKVAGVVIEALDLLKLPPMHVHIRGTSLVPIGAGLGSSACLCVALLRALTDLSGKMRTAEELASLATKLERTFHGNPSGLDTAVVACEQPVMFRRGTAPQPLNAARLQTSLDQAARWPFALIDSQTRASTADMIATARPFFSGEHASQRIGAFDSLAAQAAEALRSSDVPMLAAAMNDACTLLAEAGVVTPKLHEMIHSIRRIGALAVKPTGAGGGGMLLSLLDPEKIGAQLNALRERFGAENIHEAYL